MKYALVTEGDRRGRSDEPLVGVPDDRAECGKVGG
jgi:hypothetical protein